MCCIGVVRSTILCVCCSQMFCFASPSSSRCTFHPRCVFYQLSPCTSCSWRHSSGSTRCVSIFGGRLEISGPPVWTKPRRLSVSACTSCMPGVSPWLFLG
uniref:Secreted protein n=1 Tax=Cacopsylla melanoneura TaxID=428564 RepID=A0A8D8YF64_9HEMI